MPPGFSPCYETCGGLPAGGRASCTRPRTTTRLPMDRTQKIALASAAVGALVLALKFVAYRLTGSVALYSDALESIINVAAAAAAFVALRVSARPADAGHPFGHYKAEYFSAVL